jgi:hypothetical protein
LFNVYPVDACATHSAEVGPGRSEAAESGPVLNAIENQQAAPGCLPAAV